MARDVLVAVCMERSVELVAALCGILKAGGAYPFSYAIGLSVDGVSDDLSHQPIPAYAHYGRRQHLASE